MIPTGRLIIVASPFLGTVEAPPGAKVPLPGSLVSQGQPIFVVKPILSPEARATMAPLLKEADGQVRTAQGQLKIARIALDRAENAVRDKLLPAAALIDAKAQFDVAQTAVKAAEERHDELRKIALDPEAGSGMTTLTFRAPVKGILQNVHAQEGQPVPVAAPCSTWPAWTRSGSGCRYMWRPGAAGGRQAGGRRRPVHGARGACQGGRPVTAPPSGDPLAATVFLYYEVENHGHALRPGQRVGIALPFSGDEHSLAVPRSALIRDALGGLWVYENIAPHAYSRRRVFVDRVVGDLAALSGGLKPGTRSSAEGGAELYGAEFGDGIERSCRVGETHR